MVRAIRKKRVPRIPREPLTKLWGVWHAGTQGLTIMPEAEARQSTWKDPVLGDGVLVSVRIRKVA